MRMQTTIYRMNYHVNRFSILTKSIASLVLSALLLGTLTGCDTKAGSGALIGGAAGAGLGAIIGHNSHGHTAGGAVIGGAIGAIGGAIVGNEMDKSDQREAQRDRMARDAYARSGPPAPVYYSDRVTKEDVMSWTSHGMRAGEIIDRIDRSNTVYHLSAADESDLRESRVSEDVIIAMKDTARR